MSACLRLSRVCHMRAEVIEGIPPEELQKVLTGRKLLKACRKGKQMWIEMDGGVPALMLHFGAEHPQNTTLKVPLSIQKTSLLEHPMSDPFLEYPSLRPESISSRMPLCLIKSSSCYLARDAVSSECLLDLPLSCAAISEHGALWPCLPIACSFIGFQRVLSLDSSSSYRIDVHCKG